MKTAAHTTFAERLGQMLGRARRGCAHLDRRAQGWLLARGWAPGTAKATLLAAKLVAFGLLLYAVLWPALLLAFAIAAAWTARNGDWNDKPESEWKDGPAGFGLYTYDGYRIDPHVSDEDR